MNLYLVRHATRPDDGDDLTPVGFAEAKKLGGLFAGLNLPAGSVTIVASDAPRATHTAQAIAAALGIPATEIQSYPELSPALRPDTHFAQDFAALASAATQHLIYIGHLGNVNVLCARLVGGVSDNTGSSVFPGIFATAACVTFAPPGAPNTGRLQWLVTPALLAAVPP